MELRQLEYVVAAIDHGTFTAAAAALHVTQPTLSYGIDTLERELAVQLFRRVGRGVELSDVGARFEPWARRALREADAARAAVRDALDLRVGELTIVSLPTLVVEPLSRWVGEMVRAHPGVRVVIHDAEEARDVPDAVRAGRADLGLAELEGDHAGLTSVLSYEQELVAICPAGTSVGHGSVSLSRLVHLPFVATPTGTSMRRLVEAAYLDAGLETRVAVEVDHREAIVPLVLAGAGMSFVPQRVADQASEKGAVVVRIRPALTRTVGLLRRTGDRAPAATAFVELATGSQPGV